MHVNMPYSLASWHRKVPQSTAKWKIWITAKACFTLDCGTLWGTWMLLMKWQIGHVMWYCHCCYLPWLRLWVALAQGHFFHVVPHLSMSQTPPHLKEGSKHTAQVSISETEEPSPFHTHTLTTNSLRHTCTMVEYTCIKLNSPNLISYIWCNFLFIRYRGSSMMITAVSCKTLKNAIVILL